jgi:hypothetical protein
MVEFLDAMTALLPFLLPLPCSIAGWLSALSRGDRVSAARYALTSVAAGALLLAVCAALLSLS